MPEFISIPIETDPDDLAAIAFEYLSGLIPGWVPAESHLETWTIEALANMTAESRDVASDVPAAIFKYFGSSLAGLPPIEATQATGQATVTVVDNAGYTILAGTLFSIASSTENIEGFSVFEDVVIDPGDTATAAGEVTLIAVEAGAAASGLTADPELIDSVSYITGATLVGTTSGGVDEELEEVYLDRLVRELQLQTPTPILPADFSALVVDSFGLAERSITIDGYNPADDTFDNERMVCVFSIDINGDEVGAVPRAEILSRLDEMREVNFLVKVAVPTYTTVNVTYAATVLPDFDADEVEIRIDEAITQYINKATWGITDTEPWHNETKVRYRTVARIIGNVQGVDFVGAINLGSGADTDKTLTATTPVTIAQIGTLAGTVT